MTTTTPTLPPTARPDLDRHLERLVERKDAWTRVDLAGRIRYLGRCIDGVLEVAQEWVELACRRRGLDPASSAAGEEWLSGPMTTVRGLRLYRRALQHEGAPPPRSWRTTSAGQRIACVFPQSIFERILYYGIRAEIWIEPDHPASQGRLYRDKAQHGPRPGRVALVLGAGNIASIAPLDAAHKLLVEDEVVVLKMNPVNEDLGPLLEHAFAPLIEDGFLTIVYGGGEVGSYLARHDSVESLHLTGSHRTHDTIVWGADSREQAWRKQADRPLLSKPVSAELGCVTPILVVPGAWSKADLDFQAHHVAAMVAHNASFNCTAGKVLVLDREWPQREAFLTCLRRAMHDAPPRRAYYPGARERYATFLEHYPQAEVIGRDGEDVIPWTLIPDVPTDEGEYALSHEAFCGVLAQLSLEGANDPRLFLDLATSFANERVWGTLSCVVLIDPRSARTHAAQLERAVERLRYGGIGINVWTGLNFGLGSPSWGAFPGHTSDDVVSGRGAVHNMLLFDHPQKSVVRAPFRIWPRPVWFAEHRNLNTLGRLLTRYEGRPSPWLFLRVLFAGLRD